MGLLFQIDINYPMLYTLLRWPVGNILYVPCNFGSSGLYLSLVWHIGQHIYALPLIPGTLSFPAMRHPGLGIIHHILPSNESS